jgi:hypothetical protein
MTPCNSARHKQWENSPDIENTQYIYPTYQFHNSVPFHFIMNFYFRSMPCSTPSKSRALLRRQALLTVSRLVIWHTEHKGIQRVLSHRFKGKTSHGVKRQNLVFVPQSCVKSWYLGTIWFCKVLVVFALTDTAVHRHQCAMCQLCGSTRGTECQAIEK